jgi:hypothetical protein
VPAIELIQLAQQSFDPTYIRRQFVTTRALQKICLSVLSGEESRWEIFYAFLQFFIPPKPVCEPVFQTLVSLSSKKISKQTILALSCLVEGIAASCAEKPASPIESLLTMLLNFKPNKLA